jgi:hypothetical protein
MSLVEIKERLALLPRADQQELIGFLLSQGRTAREEREFRQQLTRTRDDDDPKNWLTRDEARRELGL